MAMAFCFGVSAQEEKNQEKVKIAVMEFEEGVGLNKSEVNGLSDMLINSLFKGGKFSIVERSQLNKVLTELNLQRNTEFSQKDLARMGELLGVRALILGRVNFMASGKEVKDGSEVVKGEYNVDVRAVLCENGELITTAGATKTNDITYRDLMENIAKQLEENLVVPEKVEPVLIPVVEAKVKNTGDLRKNGWKAYALGEFGYCLEEDLHWRFGAGAGKVLHDKIINKDVLVSGAVEYDASMECANPFFEAIIFGNPYKRTLFYDLKIGYCGSIVDRPVDYWDDYWGYMRERWEPKLEYWPEVRVGVGYQIEHSMIGLSFGYIDEFIGLAATYRFMFDL